MLPELPRPGVRPVGRVGEFVDEIAQDRGGFREDELAVLDDRGLAELVHFGKRRGRAKRIGARIFDQVVALTEILHQPDDAHRAGILKAVNVDHRVHP